jgi:hypothetical protein
MLIQGLGNTVMFQFGISGTKSFEKCLGLTRPTELRAGGYTRSFSHAFQLRYDQTDNIKDVIRAGKIMQVILGRGFSIVVVELLVLYSILGIVYYIQS